MTIRSQRSYLVLLLIVGLWTTFACDDAFEHAQCKWGKKFSEQSSPDKLLVARVQGLFCKPKVENIIRKQVQISRTNDWSSSQVVFETGGKYTVKASWLDSRHLLIECEEMPPGVENLRVDQWEEITISYKC